RRKKTGRKGRGKRREEIIKKNITILPALYHTNTNTISYLTYLLTYLPYIHTHTHTHTHVHTSLPFPHPPHHHHHPPPSPLKETDLTHHPLPAGTADLAHPRLLGADAAGDDLEAVGAPAPAAAAGVAVLLVKLAD